MTKRFLVALLGIAISVLTLPAHATPPVPASGPLSGGEDLQWSQDLEARIKDNTWYGQVYDVDKDANGVVTSVNHFGDSALWTGTYLAAESFRFALATKKLRGPLTKEDRDFWRAQKDDAKPRIDAMAAKFHMLINISKNWTNTNGPTIAPPKFNLGGTVYKGGEAGNLFRACMPTTAPQWQRWGDDEISRSRRIYGPLKWDDGQTYWCEDGTSRDAYAGTTFGLLTAFDFVGPYDHALRERIRDDYVTLAAFLVKYGWEAPRPNGRVFIPIGTNHDGAPCTSINPTLDICGHDFESTATVPFMQQTPIHRLNIASGAWHMVHAAPGRSDVAFWDAVRAEELATQLPAYPLEMEVDDFQPTSSYYKFNLNHLTSFDVARIERDPGVHQALMAGFGVMDSTTRDDINAHFESLTYATTGETSRLNDAVQHLREWRKYYTRIHTVSQTRNSLDCGSTITCVPNDQLEEDIAGQAVVIPGTAGNRAKDPIAVEKRPPGDFLWQKSVWQLDGNEGTNHYYPGIDYLLPYWLIRYYTESDVPSLDPFPAWPGPVHN